MAKIPKGLAERQAASRAKAAALEKRLRRCLPVWVFRMPDGSLVRYPESGSPLVLGGDGRPWPHEYAEFNVPEAATLIKATLEYSVSIGSL